MRETFFCSDSLSGCSKVMQEKNPDWHLVAKCMMYDFSLFNSEICDSPSDSEKINFKATKETNESDMENESKVSYSVPYWEETASRDFN